MNTTPNCCVCLEPAETIADTPCNHPDPICEACYSKLIKCPLCRLQWWNEVSDLELVSENDNELNERMIEAAAEGHLEMMLNQGG